MDNISQPQIQSARQTHKEVSIARIITLGLFGFLFGVLFNFILNIQMPWYVLPPVLAVVLGALGYIWKVRVYDPLSMEDLTPFEWAIWLPVSIAISPFVSGTIAYYIYKHKNKYPLKWRRINIILLIGLLVDGFIWFLFLKS